MFNLNNQEDIIFLEDLWRAVAERQNREPPAWLIPIAVSSLKRLLIYMNYLRINQK